MYAVFSPMKKALAAVSTLIALIFSKVQLAYAAVDDSIKLSTAQTGGIQAQTPLNEILKNAFTLVFSVSALLVLVMLIWGAISWIMSGGDKDAVASARKRIINALIGLAILALAFFIVRFVGQIVGFDILGNLKIPTLGQTVGAPAST